MRQKKPGCCRLSLQAAPTACSSIERNPRLSPTPASSVSDHISKMSRRSQGIALIQSLSIDEGTRQPTAADWLIEQDRKDRARARNRSYGRRRLQPLFRLFPSASF